MPPYALIGCVSHAIARSLYLAIIATCIFLAVRSTSAQIRPDDVAVHAALDTLLTDLHRRGWFDGALVAGRGDTVLYAQGFGYANVGENVPFTPRTPSDGGSIAKTFTAVAIWMLQEDGVLRLNDPVERYLPGYPYPGTTVSHLITHRTGGLPDYDYFWERIRPDSVLTNERLLALLRENPPPLRYPPGDRFVYDSPAFDLAALVVARATGRPFESFLRERITAPLGIDSLSLFVRPARLADWPGIRTMSYRREGDSLVVYDVWDGEGFYGGSNLYFSAEALYRWVTSFYAHPVLRPPTLQAGLGPVSLNDSRETGINMLNWYADDARRRFEYPGVLQGFHSLGYWDAEQGLSFSIVSNSDMPQGVRPLLAQAIAEILETGRPVRIILPNHAPLGEDIAAVVGSYMLEGPGTVHFALQDGAPFARVGDGPAYRAYKVNLTTLYVPGLDAWITFESREDGLFQRVHWTTVFHTGAGQRVK